MCTRMRKEDTVSQWGMSSPIPYHDSRMGEGSGGSNSVKVNEKTKIDQ